MGLTSSQLSTNTLVPICRSLATSYEAGITIKDGLKLASNHARDKRTREVLLGMSEDIQDGRSLGEAAAKQRKYLPEFFVQLLSAGEVGGQLDVMLRDLAEYYEDRQRMRRMFMAAMVLPCIYLAAAWFLGTFSLRLVMRLNFMSTEPFSLGEYFKGYLIFQGIAMLVFAGIVIGCIILARMGIFKWIIGWVTNFVWPFKPVTRRFALARFFRSLSLLIGSGLNILHCIKNAAAVTANPYIQRDLEKAIPFVKDGATLVQAFSASRSLTPIAREMLAVGEHSGNLEGALRKVAQYHLDEANQAVRIASIVLFVVILLLVGGLIGWIVITFWTKYYGAMLNIG